MKPKKAEEQDTKLPWEDEEEGKDDGKDKDGNR